MKVAVVILNWNGRKLLEQFLPSVVSYSKEATLYVADNNSSDDSVLFLKQNYPSVNIIQNTANGGYAKGYNDALAKLSEDIIVLLNSDIEVTHNWLSPLLSEFEKDSQLVAAQPKILDFKNKEYFEYAGAAGGFLDALGYPFCRGRIFTTLEKDEGQYDDIKTIFWATGACLFVRNDAFKTVEGFDEDFFAHQEEIDLCWRLQASGGVIKYVGTSKVYHVGGATLTSANPRKTFYNFRNTLLLIVKNVQGIQAWYKILIRMILDGVAFFQFLLEGKPNHAWAIFRAHLSFYRLLPSFLRKRKKEATQLKYSEINSIIWAYFIQKKKKYHQL
ncbi:glycosyltransferase family 2 protein [Jejudonia soesokkakensis]|uniref:Glycosyltransferase family 2 protein n=1 Tax=Jejudonia soesokkakensis TaxID=1323432 RepID=A0ABW2MTK0_9FLAO